ncbi:MAG: preprotein translocase subunit SecE [Kiritimatiellae bacterium]|nr:preprotein translocase subunit SecE [Kiritimatiellia bacterium]
MSEEKKNIFDKTKGFLGDVVLELKKTSWPTKQELTESTGLVIVFILMLAAFVGASDWFFQKLIKLLISL